MALFKFVQTNYMDTSVSLFKYVNAFLLQSQIYKEDFLKERDDRAHLHTQLDDLRKKSEEESIQLEEHIRKLQVELRRAETDLRSFQDSVDIRKKTGQRKVHELESALALAKTAQEESKTKALQVTQYKKQADQLHKQVSTCAVVCTIHVHRMYLVS